MAHHLFLLGVGELIRELRAIDGNRGHGTCVDELLHARALRSVQQIPRSANIRIVNLPRATGQQPVIGRHVEDAFHAFHGALKRSRVTQVACHILERQIRNRAIGARSAHQHAHIFTARHQLPSQVAAEKSGRSCNKCGHAILTLSLFVSASASMPAPLFSALRTVSTSPPKTGSTSCEKNSHQRFPINFWASAVFRRGASPDRLAELAPPVGEITTPSTSSVLACRMNSATSLSFVSSSIRACTHVRKPESRATRNPSIAP